MGNKPSRPEDSEIRQEVHKLSEILPNLFLTCRQTAQKVSTFRDNNITAVVSLTTNNINYPEGVLSKHFHVQDSFFFILKDILDEAVEFIKEMHSQNRKVLVHCEVGVSRSASCVIAFLMKMNNWCFKDAFLYVKERRSIVQPNPGFTMQLYEYQMTNKIKDTKANRLFVRDTVDQSNGLYKEIPTYALWNAFIESSFCYEKAIKDRSSLGRNLRNPIE